MTRRIGQEIGKKGSASGNAFTYMFGQPHCRLLVRPEQLQVFRPHYLNVERGIMFAF